MLVGGLCGHRSLSCCNPETSSRNARAGLKLRHSVEFPTNNRLEAHKKATGSLHFKVVVDWQNSTLTFQQRGGDALVDEEAPGGET